MSALTRAVLRYKRFGTDFDEVRGRISMIVYDYPDQRYGLDEDTRGEFLLYMMPEIDRMVRRYEPRDVPFEHYLAACMRWKLMSFLNAKKRKTIREKMEYDHNAWSELTPSLELAEPPGLLSDRARVPPDSGEGSATVPVESPPAEAPRLQPLASRATPSTAPPRTRLDGS